MQPISVHSTKYDGSLHYRYPMYVVQQQPKHLVLYGPAGTVFDSYRGQYIASFHMLQLHWTDRFYNVEVMWHEDWRPRMHYVNIATPSTWDDGTLRFIDLDLDVIWRASTNEVLLDDEDEFAAHQIRFSYPSELIVRAQQMSDTVREMMQQRIYPFDGSLYAWRPDGIA